MNTILWIAYLAYFSSVKLQLLCVNCETFSKQLKTRVPCVLAFSCGSKSCVQTGRVQMSDLKPLPPWDLAVWWTAGLCRRIRWAKLWSVILYTCSEIYPYSAQPNHPIVFSDLNCFLQGC